MTPEGAIRSIAVRPLELPLARPVRTAVGTMASTPVVLIDIHAQDGLTGRSYLRTYTPVALRALAALVEDLAPLIEGNPADPATTLRHEFALLGTRGLTGAALAGIDMALWDLDAQRAGVSLARHLGGEVATIPAYQSLLSTDPAGAAAEAAQAVAGGFGAVKVKAGHGDLDGDVELVGAVRAAIGPSAELMVDYNQSLAVEEAIRRGRALQAQHLTWIEEPTRAHDLAGHVRISAALATPLNVGENLEGPDELQAAIAAGAAKRLTFDAMRIGGVTGWMQAAEHAARAGLPVSSHAFPEYSVHLLAATPTSQWLERLDHVAPILLRPVEVRDGHALVPEGPGAGLEWDEPAVKRLRSG